MDDGEFCAACGATGRALVDGICAPCAAERLPLLRSPGRATIVLCPTCGARQVGNHWERAGAAAILTGADLDPHLAPHPEVGIRAVRWEELSSSGGVHAFEGRVRLRFRDIEREAVVRLEAKVESRACPDCSRKSGRYYTAQIQLRAAEDAPREKAEARRSRLGASWDALLEEARPDWRKAISWAEALPEGWDFFVVDTLAARSLARLARQRLGATVVESATLSGRKDGRDLYRVTLCLRLPASAPEALGRRRSPSDRPPTA